MVPGRHHLLPRLVLLLSPLLASLAYAASSNSTDLSVAPALNTTAFFNFNATAAAANSTQGAGAVLGGQYLARKNGTVITATAVLGNATAGRGRGVATKGGKGRNSPLTSSTTVRRTSSSSTRGRTTSLRPSASSTRSRNSTTPTTSPPLTTSRANSSLTTSHARANSTTSRSRNSTSTLLHTSTTRTRLRSTTSSSTNPPRTTLVATRRPSTTSRAILKSSQKVPKPSSTKSKSASPSKAKSKAPPKPRPTPVMATAPLPCTPAPSTFIGTHEGFANVCWNRYCPAKTVTNMVWDGNEGDVTRNEIETALGMLGTISPITENGQGNVLSDGNFGQGAYNAGLLFEMTGDIRALDVIIRLADNILALRNDPETGLEMWSGNRELVWPTTPLAPNNVSELPYAGCEQGSIVGNMVNAAVYILKSPCLWNLVPPGYDGPTVFTNTDTYLTRALAFVQAGDETMDSYFIKYFLDENKSLIQPNDTRWNLVNDRGNSPGAPMPWNRRMLILHGFLRLAAAHETMPAFDPVRVWKYDAIIQWNIKEFVASLNETQSDEGFPTYIWNYVDQESQVEESMGVHGYFDIWGLWLAWQRNPTLFGVSEATATRFANTFQYTIHLGNGTFAGLVNGDSTIKSRTIPGLWGGWSFYAYWLPEWFDTLVDANLESGFNSRSWLAVPLLWTKHARAWNNEPFWRSAFSTGYGLTDGTVTSVAVRLQDVITVQAGMGKRAVKVVEVSGAGRVGASWVAVGVGIVGWTLTG